MLGIKKTSQGNDANERYSFDIQNRIFEDYENIGNILRAAFYLILCICDKNGHWILVWRLLIY